MNSRLFFLCLVTSLSLIHRFAPSQEDRPHGTTPLMPGVKLTLIAEHPDIATPTGISVDEKGQIWAVACHTHFPPDDYAGPKTDQILVFDSRGNRSIFYDKLHHTMDLELGPEGWVYLAERDRIFRIRDSDGDGRADTEEDLAVLETEADYPHNGLSALAFHPRTGELHFGLGENYAKGWTLTGKDGEVYKGYGEGGIFKCSPDGTKLHRIASGMWNPFGLLVREDGEIFACENDPGERPPCRLLHIVEGGNYGYQRIYGNEAHHPFVCLNGQLRGTLPMIHPSGEAPCGVAQLGRGLIVPSWSDHRIDFFSLSQKGASYSAKRIQLVGGSRYFRPVCIAPVPVQEQNKLTWFLTDWVDGRYQVHGYGRLWKLEIDLNQGMEWIGPLDLLPLSEEAKFAAKLRNGDSELKTDALLNLQQGKDPFLDHAVISALAKSRDWNPDLFGKLSDANRPRVAIAIKLSGAEPTTWIPVFLNDKQPDVQFEALRWISDSNLKSFQAEVDALLQKGDLEFQLFEAALAARNRLLGKPEQGVRDAKLLLSKVLDESASPRLRAYALRLLPSRKKSVTKLLTTKQFRKLLKQADEQLALETVRVLTGNKLLLAIARDETKSGKVRAEAIAGLGKLIDSNHGLLIRLAHEKDRSIREEALRALRIATLSETEISGLLSISDTFPDSTDLVHAIVKPAIHEKRPALTDTAAWLALLDTIPGPADPDTGRRIFHNARIGQCGNCHRYEGRGNVVGPDLSLVMNRGSDRSWLLESILNPNAEIGPEYLPREMTLKDGTSVVGIRLRSSTREVIRDVTGRSHAYNRDDIASMKELQMSLMPPGLLLSMTNRELRDLLAFLSTETN